MPVTIGRLVEGGKSSRTRKGKGVDAERKLGMRGFVFKRMLSFSVPGKFQVVAKLSLIVPED